MKLQTWRDVVTCLPVGRTVFRYAPDQFAVMVLRYLLEAGHDAAELKRSRFGRLFERKPVRELLAAHGRADLTVNHLHYVQLDKSAPWRLSLGRWGNEKHWRWQQVSRPGVNLVLQLDFTRQHDETFDRLLGGNAAPCFVCEHHPHNVNGRTFAWARIDVDFDTGEALIEEIQSDWVRAAGRMAERGPSRHDLRRLSDDDARSYLNSASGRQALRTYRDEVLMPAVADWQETVMAAAMFFIVEELGLREVYMHQFDNGNRLKNIDPRWAPPRSIYTDLPRRFCFEKSSDIPSFLKVSVRTAARKARRHGKDDVPSGFWKLDLRRREKGHAHLPGFAEQRAC